jgi:signal recognition particle receptor subunit beta
VLAHLLLSRARRSRDALLLLGLSGCGKTALFSRLSRPPAAAPPPLQPTVPSMAENVCRLARVGRRPLRCVDLPGHARLRSRLDAFAPSAAGLVFVVDGREVAFLPSSRDAAECAALRCS